MKQALFVFNGQYSIALFSGIYIERLLAIPLDSSSLTLPQTILNVNLLGADLGNLNAISMKHLI